MSRRHATYSGQIRVDHLHPRHKPSPISARVAQRDTRLTPRRPGRRTRRAPQLRRHARRALAVTVLAAVLFLAVGYRTTTWQDGQALYLNSHRVDLIDATTRAAHVEADVDDVLTATTLGDPGSILDGFERSAALAGNVADWLPPREFTGYQAALTASLDALVAWIDNLASQVDAGVTDVVDDPALAGAFLQQRAAAQQVLARTLQAHDLAGTYRDHTGA